MPMQIGTPLDIPACKAGNLHVVNLSLYYLACEVPIYIGMTWWWRQKIKLENLHYICVIRGMTIAQRYKI